VRMPNGDTTDLGTVRVKATPEENRYRLSLALSGRVVTTTAKGFTTSRMAFEEFRAEGLWDKEFFEFLEFTMGAGDLRASGVGNEWIEVRELTLDNKFVEREGGFWDSPTVFRASDITAAVDGGASLITANKLSVHGATEGLRLEAYREFRKNLGFDPETGQWDPEVLAKGFKWPDVFPLFGRRTSVETSVQGIVVQEGQAERLSLGTASVAFGARDMEEELGVIEIKGGYDDLLVPSGEEGEAPPPHKVGFDMAVERFPGQRILAAVFGASVRAAADVTASAGMGEFPAQAALFALFGAMGAEIEEALYDAGTEYVVRGISVEGDRYGFEVQGHLKADRQSVRKAFGAFTIAISGEDALVSGVPDLLPVIGADPQTLATIQELGEKAEDAAGNPVVRYRIDVTPEGPVLLNGQDMDKVLAGTKVH
jgi:hypothetical protein